MKFKNDPIGFAIDDFNRFANLDAQIIVQSDLCEDDILPVPYLFRSHHQMPAIEKMALHHCQGKVLDIGAGAGCHSIHLLKKGFEVTALEASKGAADFLSHSKIPVIHTDFMNYSASTYDTILMLMNGIGLAGSVNHLPAVLKHLSTLLNPGGIILLDSTDIQYMYEVEDGSIWIDLNAPYYGEMQFNMVYKGVESGWFPWLYIDPVRLAEICNLSGFEIKILSEGKNNHYLALLKKK
ncbi:MAG: methyltransferase domain-containing protein [Crocinitomicaceae bacterium]